MVRDGMIKTFLKRFLFFFRNRCIKIRYLRLRNKKISIISNNCIGGYLYNNFGCKFLSPTINLQIEPEDFVKFCNNITSYLNENIVEQKNYDPAGFKALGGSDIDFPVGKLKDIIIYFQHYTTFKEGYDKWNERKERINMENLFFILCDTYCDGKTVCKKETIDMFLNIPYKNKLFVTDNKNYDGVENCCYIEANGDSWFNRSKKINKQYFYKFDFEKWFLNSR